MSSSLFSPCHSGPRRNNRKKDAFTLIELLIVIAIIAILSITVVLTLNPAEMLRQSRDSNRISDMDTLNKAIALYVTDNATQGGVLSLGNASTVYLSLIDNASSTCGSLGLPSLPTGYGYHCASATSSRLNDSNGWLPVNLKNISYGSPLGSLPIDPTNVSSSGLYYSYVTDGGQYQLSSHMESAKYASNEVASGGTDPALYTAGTNLSLAPFVGGLVGYWPFDEGSGSVAYDMSGYGNNGTMYSSTTVTNIHTTTGCKIGGCANFNGIDNMILAQGGAKMISIGNSALTIMAWGYKTSAGGGMLAHQNGPFFLGMGSVMGSSAYEILAGGAWTGIVSSQILNTNTWYQIAITYDNAKGLVSNYVNGVLDGTGARTGTINQAVVCVGIGYSTNGGCTGAKSGFFPGLIDDVRIYNRALSAREIQEMYNAGK